MLFDVCDGDGLSDALKRWPDAVQVKVDPEAAPAALAARRLAARAADGHVHRLSRRAAGAWMGAGQHAGALGR